MAVCYNCEKTTMMGRTHTHKRGVAGGRWKKRAPKVNRTFRANLQTMSILENGVKKQVRLCTKCLKRIKYDVEKGQRPFLKLYQPEN